MRPTEVQVTGAPGNSCWVPINYLQVSFGVGLFASLSQDAATVNYSVFHTPDDVGPDGGKIASITRAGTTATATFLASNPHKLATNDTIIVAGSGSSNLDSQPYLGVAGNPPVPYTVTVTGPLTLTYTVANSGPTADAGNTRIWCQRCYPHASLVNLTARADGNYAFSVRGVLLRANTLTAGSIYLDVLQGLGR